MSKLNKIKNFKMKKVFLFLTVVSLFSCTEAPKSIENTGVHMDSTTLKSTTTTVSTDSLVIVVDSTGAIMMGKEVVSMANLEIKLVDSLQNIKKLYGKLPDTVICNTKGDVLMGTRGAIKDVILDAKEKVEKQ